MPDVVTPLDSTYTVVIRKDHIDSEFRNVNRALKDGMILKDETEQLLTITGTDLSSFFERKASFPSKFFLNPVRILELARSLSFHPTCCVYRAEAIFFAIESSPLKSFEQIPMFVFRAAGLQKLEESTPDSALTSKRASRTDERKTIKNFVGLLRMLKFFVKSSSLSHLLSDS